MKRLCILLTLILVLFMFISTSAAVRATHKSAGYGSGKWSVGGYVGYGFGFGDAFDEYTRRYYVDDFDWVGYSWENRLTFNLGAKVKYRYSPQLSFTGCLDYQAGDVKEIRRIGHYYGAISGSYDWTAILVDAVYSLSPSKVTIPYLNGGLGLYSDGDTDPGMNFGGGIEHFFQDNLALDIATMFHIVFTSGQNTTYLQIKGGLNYYFGE